jgi:adenylate cyclase
VTADLQQTLPHVLVSLVALGMALSFIVADRESPTSRALAVAFAFIGISVDLNVVTPMVFELSARFRGVLALSESVAMYALLEWILRVRRTVPTRNLYVTAGDQLLRWGQAAAVVYGLLSLALPEIRIRDFLGGLAAVDAWSKPGFWLFAVPIFLATATAINSMLLLLNRRPDQPEKHRVIALLIAIPFLAAGFVVPIEYAPLTMMLGLMIFMVGAVQYHVMQGQRGQFMAQFLSPQVAELVRSQGLKQAMQQNYMQISVVCADLRGFTAVTEATAPDRVLRILREYYQMVGDVVADFGGTVKDQAGDGVLILVGAPIAVPDHAERALVMARHLRQRSHELKRRWASEGLELGLGIGVASGPVTVGVIGGSTSRLEYTAVGAAVNLAARLCQQAADGEILVDGSTHDAVLQETREACEPREPLMLKGFALQVRHYAG